MSNLEQVLEDCLVILAHDEATLEECLARYPEHAGELRPLLTTAVRLDQGRQVRPSPAFKSRTRAQLTAHMRTHPHQPRPGLGLAWWPRGFGLALGQAFNLAFNTAAVGVLVLATVTVLAQMALPGNALYGWKIASEQAWRAVHLDPFNTDLLLTGRRVSELTQVADDPQAAEIARQKYQQALTTLMGEYSSPESQKIISNTLVVQKEILDEAGVSIPELDPYLPALNQADLLLENRVESIENGLITYTLTLTNAGPASPVTATLTSHLALGEEFVSASDAACQESAGVVTCPLDNLATTTPRHLKLTTAIDSCYAGVITQTTQVTGPGSRINPNINNEAAAVSTITAPYPQPAVVAYVQSNSQTHDLGLVSSDNRLLNGILHRWGAAPAWSPDRIRLAFFGEPGISDLSSVYSQGNGVWLVDMANAQAQNPRLLVSQDHIKNIVWSPDGSKLAYEVGLPDMPHEIRVVDSKEGREVSRFSGEQPAWSPDSKKLVIKSCDSECGLWQVNLDGSGGQQLTFAETDSYPAWSLTGEYLAFASERDQNWEIYLLRLADGELQRLTRRPGTDTTPVFGPCGQNLYLRTDSYGSWWITVMKLDGSDERKVQEGVGFSDDWGLARPAVR